MTITLRDVRYRYAGSPLPALDGVSLDLAPGEVLGVVGPNEAGKTTLCLVASGLAPTAIGGRLDGAVAIDGAPTIGLRMHELAQRVGILFQDPHAQLSGTAATVFEEVAFGPRNLGLPVAEVVHRTEWALGVAGVVDLAARDPARLSGGQAQLVALASVLALRPAHLIVDEPTSELDPHGTALVGNALGRLADETGAAVLVVEHKTGLLARYTKRVVVLGAGRILREGPSAEVLRDPGLAELGIALPPDTALLAALDSSGLTVDEGTRAVVEAAAREAGMGGPAAPDAVAATADQPGAER